MFSFSKYTSTLFSFSWRTAVSVSTVFLANREMLFVMIKSIFPANASAIMRLNPSRFFVFVPLMPSSE